LLQQCRSGISTAGGHDVGPFHHEYQCWTGADGKQVCRGFSFDDQQNYSTLDKSIGGIDAKVLKDAENWESAKEHSCSADDNNKCMDNCAADKWRVMEKLQPHYGLLIGQTCQGVQQDVYNSCKKICGSSSK